MKTADQGVTAPLNSPGRECEDRDIQRIPRLPGNQNGVYMRLKSPQPPAKARMGGGGEFQMTGALLHLLISLRKQY